MIDRIRIQNFRSLIDVDVNLEPLTVLIGRSGTGKSNFVGAIRTLRDMLHSRQTDRPPQSAPLSQPQAQLAFDVSLRLNGKPQPYRYQLGLHGSSLRIESLTAGTQAIFAQGGNKWTTPPSVAPPPQAGPLALGSLTGLRDATIVFNLLSRGIGCYDFPGNVLQTPAEQRPQTGYWDNGQNPLAVASAIFDDIDRLNDWTALTHSMTSLNSAVRSIDLTLPGRDKLQVGYQVGEKIMLMDVAAESEGFRRYFATLLALYQAPSKQTLIFEHPENGIHPGALETLANEFKRHVKKGRGQIILTTHSPQLLDHFEPEQIRVVHIENQETKIGPLDPLQLKAVHDELLKPSELLTVDEARLAGQLAEVPA